MPEHFQQGVKSKNDVFMDAPDSGTADSSVRAYVNSSEQDQESNSGKH